MIDNHVHMGWYTDGYHSPLEMWLAVQEAGVDEIVVSSTTTCAELYKVVVREMKELIRLGGNSIHPVLWLTPRMMKTWGIRYMLHSKIKWQGVKMHWMAHREWYYNKKLMNDALDVARKLSVPVLLHTGNFKECHAGVFKTIFQNNPDLTFVLAHGRPIDETLGILTQCANTYVDTAFMPVEDFKIMVEAGFSKRILFGTDAPINLLFYKDMSTADYIKSSIETIKKEFLPSVQNQVFSNKVYGI